MRISILKTVFRTLVFSLFLLASSTVRSQSEVGFTILSTTPSQSGDQVVADVMVYNFNDILSLQFTIAWDPAELAFLSVNNFNLPDLNGSGFGLTELDDGVLRLSWIDNQTSGVSAEDCTTIFSIVFQTINGTVPPIEVVDDPLADEIVNADFEFLDFIQTPFCADAGTISGNVYYDLNDDCLYDLDEIGMEDWIVQFDGNGTTSYASTDADGDYHKLLAPGNYDVTVILPENDLWTACTPTQTVALDTFANETVDFPVQAFLQCPSLSVDFSAAFLRRCFNSTYNVHYCNNGTLPAEDAFVEIEFDPYLEVVGSSVPWSSVAGNVYTFPIDDVPVGGCGSFYVEVLVDCDAVLGQTHCSVAHIFPDDPCIPTSPLWDGSDLEITGTCDGDSVRFEIKNLGDDMAEPLEFIVIEDDMIYLTSDPVQLFSQETTTVVVEANGSTWRLEMPQTPNNPFGTFATDAVEGCGTNGSGSFSLGFVTQFPEDEESPAVDEDCQENVGSFDPNDKIGYPKGFCAAQYIKAGQDIEYKIRFQNTGTDTAFNVIVRDTLSLSLDPASVVPGASSHPYNFEISGEGALEFSFPDIMLPDSNVNEQASHGFVKFTISQKPNLPMGTVINNGAAIYFDFNDPVITNTYHHTIGDDFVEMSGQSGDLSVSGYVRTWHDDSPVENVAMTMTDLCPVFTDSYGYFLHENIDTAVYALSASKENDDPKNGITVLDLVKLGRHILGLDTFNYYQILAADGNGTASITTFDLVNLGKIILGTPVGDDFSKWKFVTADFDPDQPATGSTFYAYNPLNTSLDGQDFIAIQPGNVITEPMVETSSINTEFYFEPNQVDGNTLRVDVKANGFTSVNAFQFGLKWDGSVIQLGNIEPGVLASPPNSWSNFPNPEQLSMFQLSGGQGWTTTPDEVLFTLVFNVLAPVGTTTLIELDETNLPLQVVVDTCKLAGASVTGTEVTIEDPNAVIDFDDIGLQVKIAPNPIRQGQAVSLEMKTATARRLSVQLFDMNGTLHHAGTFQGPVGRSVYHINADLKKGIYFMKINAGEGVERTAKLVVY